VQRRNQEIPVVLITAFGSIESAVEAMKSGAYHYVAKPFLMEDLLVIVHSAAEARRLQLEMSRLPNGQPSALHGIVGQSAAMRNTMDLVLRAAEVDSPVLLMGERHREGAARARPARRKPASERSVRRGELLGDSQDPGRESALRTSAGSVHRRARGPSGLLSAGRRRHALPRRDRDMPLSVQGKLLRALQEHEVQPLGATTAVSVDARVVAATHRDLERRVEAGLFRSDLFYRLNVIVINIPALRERPEDIVVLVAHFLRKHGSRLGRERTVSPESLEALRRYSWPGNVRELENAIERAIVLSHDPVIGLSDLPDKIQSRPPRTEVVSSMRSIAELEQEHILRTLRAVKGNKAAAARILGLDRKTLYRKLEQYGFKEESAPTE
jgi:two-component system response regulator HydG